MICGKFYWQAGFGAFSVGSRELDAVFNYIRNQEQHPKTSTFKTEYKAFLAENQVEFKEEYLFDFNLT